MKKRAYGFSVLESVASWAPQGPTRPRYPKSESCAHFPASRFRPRALVVWNEHEIGRRTETFLQLESPYHRLLPD